MKKHGMDWPEPDKDEVGPVVSFIRKTICRMKGLRAKQVKAGDHLLSIIDPVEVPILLQDITEAKDVPEDVYTAALSFDQSRINGATTVSEFACWLAGTEVFSMQDGPTTEDQLDPF